MNWEAPAFVKGSGCKTSGLGVFGGGGALFCGAPLPFSFGQFGFCEHCDDSFTSPALDFQTLLDETREERAAVAPELSATSRVPPLWCGWAHVVPLPGSGCSAAWQAGHTPTSSRW